jgi:parallel beta-helix repeat protein
MKNRGITTLTIVAALLVGGLGSPLTTTLAGSKHHPLNFKSIDDGEILYVPRDYATIQSAVNAAGEGDTILVATGVYSENVVVSTSDVRLRGGGDVVLDGTSLSGIGIHVLGASATAPVTGVEVSDFEVRNFERGIIVEWATKARVSDNYVHDNVDRLAPAVLGDGTGIELVTASASDVSDNVVSRNGLGGIQLRVGSTDNTIHHNRVDENGSQSSTFDGVGILVTGAGTDNNQVQHNKIVANFGRGILLSRPPGTVPLSGNLVAHNRAHRNLRAGIAIMFAATGNTVVHNDARENNLSGLPPCFHCNLFDLSIGGNTWDKNLGTFNETDASCLQ